MKLIVVRSLLCASAFVSTSAAQSVAIQDLSDPHRGRLAGVVQDERGQPLARVTVRAMPPGAIGGILPNTRTDTRGRFALAGLLTGHTYLSASKEEAFYPDALGNFWDGQGSAEVEVPVGGELSGILLRLTPVGRLEVRAINDATGSPIDAIRIRLERDGAPDRYVSSSKLGDWWLVPTAPIRLRVEADGFQPAWYGGDGPEAHSAPLVLAPRQILSVTVSLRPLAE